MSASSTPGCCQSGMANQGISSGRSTPERLVDISWSLTSSEAENRVAEALTGGLYVRFSIEANFFESGKSIGT